MAERLGVTQDLKDNLETSCFAREVGDDLALVASTLFCCTVLAVMINILSVNVSWKDTCIRKDGFMNFCEALIQIPSWVSQTFHYTRNTNSETSYPDIGKMRTCTNTASMRMKLSDTYQGKASYVGARISWAVGSYKTALDLLSIYQDIFLGATSAKMCAYLPVSLGGCGKPPLFSTPANFGNFWEAYKNGKYQPYFFTLVGDLNKYVDQLEAGFRAKPSVLLQHAAHAQSTFFDWIKSNTLYSPVLTGQLPEETAKYAVKAHDQCEQLAIARLGRHLVSENTLLAAVGRHETVQALEGAETWIQSMNIQEHLKSSIRCLTPAQLYSVKLADRQFLDAITSKPSPIAMEKFVKNCNAYHGAYVKALTDPKMYLPEVLDDFYKESVFHVRMEIGLKRDEWLRIEHMEETPSYHVVEDKQYDDLIQYFRQPEGKRQINLMPTDLIEDDETILGSYERLRHDQRNAFVIISDDIKDLVGPIMAHKGHIKNPRIWVPLRMYLSSEFKADLPYKWEDRIPKKPGINWIYLKDTGSIKSHQLKWMGQEPNYTPKGFPYCKVSSSDKSRQLFAIADPSKILK